MNDYKSLNNAYKNNTRDQLNENYTATGCPASTYCPNSKEKKNFFDDSCPAGYYCPASKNVLLPISCKSGYYCPKNSKKPLPCPYYRPNSNVNSISIEDCT